MSGGKPTPGPWTAEKGKYGWQIHAQYGDRKSHWIANLKCESCPAHEEAYAHLIAAAPELLEALKAAEEWLEGWASAEPYLSEIRAAIAKAEGRTDG